MKSMYFLTKYRYRDILLKKQQHNFIYNRLFCCIHTCYWFSMVTATSLLRCVTSASCYQRINTGGLIPRNCPRQFRLNFKPQVFSLSQCFQNASGIIMWSPPSVHLSVCLTVCMLCYLLWYCLTKVRKTAKISNRHNQVPNLTLDTIWESDKYTSENRRQENQVSAGDLTKFVQWLSYTKGNSNVLDFAPRRLIS